MSWGHTPERADSSRLSAQGWALLAAPARQGLGGRRAEEGALPPEKLRATRHPLQSQPWCGHQGCLSGVHWYLSLGSLKQGLGQRFGAHLLCGCDARRCGEEPGGEGKRGRRRVVRRAAEAPVTRRGAHGERPPGGRWVSVHNSRPSWLGRLLEAWVARALSLPTTSHSRPRLFSSGRFRAQGGVRGGPGGVRHGPPAPASFRHLGERPPAAHSGGRVHTRSRTPRQPAGWLGSGLSITPRWSLMPPACQAEVPQLVTEAAPRAVTRAQPRFALSFWA